MTNAVSPDATSTPVRVGILLSGRGSNLEALLRHAHEGTFARARLACAISDVPTAPGLAAAARAGLAANALEPATFPSRAAYETEIIRRFDEHAIEWVCLAGYMRIVGKTLLTRYPSRILNIHPSLLPAFPGLHAQRQALDHGVRVAGCTVHLVDSGMDTGPIIAQATVPVVIDAGLGRQRKGCGGGGDHGVIRSGLRGSPGRCAGPATACVVGCRVRAAGSIRQAAKSTT